jgi:hypothetical protein
MRVSPLAFRQEVGTLRDLVLVAGTVVWALLNLLLVLSFLVSLFLGDLVITLVDLVLLIVVNLIALRLRRRAVAGKPGGAT